MGTLYIVSTPIGNLEDITYRAVRVLKEVDLIAAENTINSKKLLAHYGIDSKLISYHDHNKEVSSSKLIKDLQQGIDIALITDAGTPCISDPGYLVVKNCRELGIKVVPIPGASAPVTALSASGFPTDVYKFIGFLPTTQGKKKDVVAAILDENVTTVFFESPNRLEKTLMIFNELDPESNLMVGRELTKMFEEMVFGKPLEIIEKFQNSELKGRIKGELTVIFSKAKKSSEIKSEEELCEILARNINDICVNDRSTKEISKLVAAKYGVSKKMAYGAVLKVFNNKGR